MGLRGRPQPGLAQSTIAQIEESAYRTALATIEKLTDEGKTDEADQFRGRLDQALIRDCKVVVSWTGDADVDVFVEEPSGTICSYRNPRTTSGGVMLGDEYPPRGQVAHPGIFGDLRLSAGF